MRGQILVTESGGGIIAGSDGQRYTFSADMLRNGAARAGLDVDFSLVGQDAHDIYLLNSTNSAARPASSRNWPAFYFSPTGRVARGDFWLFGFLPVVVVSFVLGWIPVIGWFLLLAGQWSLLALCFKRFHDRGLSGWWSLSAFVPLGLGAGLLIYGFIHQLTGRGNTLGVALIVIAGLISVTQIVLVYLRPGVSGANRFGPDPLNG